MKKYNPFSEYGSILKDVRTYAEYYGGLGGLLKSPYVHLAILLTMLTFDLWLSNGWSHVVLSVMPPILGFSVGGFALFVSFGGDAKFIKKLSGDREGGKSPYLSVTSTFMHFILVQTSSIIYAVVGGGLDEYYNKDNLSAINFVGFFMFIYGLILVVAAAFIIFRVSVWHDRYSSAAACSSQPRDQAK
jgi:hypothetical protein